MIDLRHRPRPGTADLLILGYVLGLLVLWFPGLHFPLLTPRVVLVAIGLGPGLVVVGGLARRGDRVARWALAYLAWGLVSVAFSTHPGMAFVRAYSGDLGWLYLAGAVSAWGLGRRLSAAGRAALVWVIGLGVALNVAVALLEAVADPSGPLSSIDGRVLGLLPNPLFLAGALAGALALGGRMVARSGRRTAALVALIPVAAALNLTGTRAALVGGAMLAVVAALVPGPRVEESGARRLRLAGCVLVAVTLGVLLSTALASGTGGTDRLGNTSSTGGYRSRQIMWAESLRVAQQRPVLGWGPGRFREAVEPRLSAEFVRVEGLDRVFYEAHNIVLENLVTLGVGGLILWLGLARALFRETRGPLAWFAGGIALTWLFNPASVSTAPLALLAMGAAWHPRTGSSPPSTEPTRHVTSGRLIGAVLALIGLLAGGRLLYADHLMVAATEHHDLGAAVRAGELVPGDAVITGVESELRNRQARAEPTPTNKAHALEAAARAVRQDPTRPTWQVNFGNTMLEFGPGSEAERLRHAVVAYRRAEALNPYSFEALQMLYAVAAYQHDGQAAAHWRAKLCEIDACPNR